MTKISKPLIFFGSGPVAAETLKFLADTFNIDTVITKNKPPHHKELAPVEEYAKNKSINILYADSKKELDTIFADCSISSYCGIVVDYGVIISQKVIDYFEFGIINSHFSLLPEWRGADPITYSILSGQSKTGVSIMTIDSGLDCGQILAKKLVTISSNDTNSSLTKKLIEASNELIIDTLPLYLSGQIKPQNQSSDMATYSNKIAKMDGLIDWGKTASIVEREIRAYSMWPKSHTKIGSVEVVIINARIAENSKLNDGKWSFDNGKLLLGCKASVLEIIELKPLGKKTMSALSFINGYKNRLAK